MTPPTPAQAGPYRPPWFLGNAHALTVWPVLLRRVDGPRYRRERLETPDGDFLDLDWAAVGSRRLAVLCHGLEGSADRPYVRGMALAFNRRGWDVLALNYRGCSGEPNRLPRAYHSGATEDLDLAVDHALGTGDYGDLGLVGFSLGGNLAVKYAGERGPSLPPQVRLVAGVSVPCDLASSSRRIAEPVNRLYLQRFLFSLKAKVRAKASILPPEIDLRGVLAARDFQEYDDRFTAPVHGFRDAADYWDRCSCLGFLRGVGVPTLVLNAGDDPLLAPECYPVAQAAENPNITLEIPPKGGHVGFVTLANGGEYWHETRVAAFAASVLPA